MQGPSALAILGSALALATGGSALAASPPPSGVHIDPNSPVAKEYAIPLGQARAGGGAGAGSAGALFGSGVRSATPPGSAPPSAPSAGRVGAGPAPSTPPRGATARRVPAGQVGGGRGVVGPAAAGVGSPAEAAGRGTGSPVAWMVGIAALVLVLGGLGGRVVARRSGRGAGGGRASRPPA